VPSEGAPGTRSIAFTDSEHALRLDGCQCKSRRDSQAAALANEKEASSVKAPLAFQLRPR